MGHKKETKSMQKVPIKRVKRHQKKITPKEKILAGFGLAGSLAGGLSGAPRQPVSPPAIVSTNSQGQNSGIKNSLERIFGAAYNATVGVPTAKADYNPLDPSNTLASMMGEFNAIQSYVNKQAASQTQANGGNVKLVNTGSGMSNNPTTSTDFSSSVQAQNSSGPTGYVDNQLGEGQYQNTVTTAGNPAATGQSSTNNSAPAPVNTDSMGQTDFYTSGLTPDTSQPAEPTISYVAGLDNTAAPTDANTSNINNNDNNNASQPSAPSATSVFDASAPSNNSADNSSAASSNYVGVITPITSVIAQGGQDTSQPAPVVGGADNNNPVAIPQTAPSYQTDNYTVGLTSDNSQPAAPVISYTQGLDNTAPTGQVPSSTVPVTNPLTAFNAPSAPTTNPLTSITASNAAGNYSGSQNVVDPNGTITNYYVTPTDTTPAAPSSPAPAYESFGPGIYVNSNNPNDATPYVDVNGSMTPLSQSGLPSATVDGQTFYKVGDNYFYANGMDANPSQDIPPNTTFSDNSVVNPTTPITPNLTGGFITHLQGGGSPSSINVYTHTSQTTGNSYYENVGGVLQIQDVSGNTFYLDVGAQTVTDQNGAKLSQAATQQLLTAVSDYQDLQSGSNGAIPFNTFLAPNNQPAPSSNPLFVPPSLTVVTPSSNTPTLPEAPAFTAPATDLTQSVAITGVSNEVTVPGADNMGQTAAGQNLTPAQNTPITSLPEEPAISSGPTVQPVSPALQTIFNSGNQSAPLPSSPDLTAAPTGAGQTLSPEIQANLNSANQVPASSSSQPTAPMPTVNMLPASAVSPTAAPGTVTINGTSYSVVANSDGTYSVPDYGVGNLPYTLSQLQQLGSGTEVNPANIISSAPVGPAESSVVVTANTEPLATAMAQSSAQLNQPDSSPAQNSAATASGGISQQDLQNLPTTGGTNFGLLGSTFGSAGEAAPAAANNPSSSAAPSGATNAAGNYSVTIQGSDNGPVTAGTPVTVVFTGNPGDKVVGNTPNTSGYGKNFGTIGADGTLTLDMAATTTGQVSDQFTIGSGSNQNNVTLSYTAVPSDVQKLQQLYNTGLASAAPQTTPAQTGTTLTPYYTAIPGAANQYLGTDGQVYTLDNQGAYVATGQSTPQSSGFVQTAKQAGSTIVQGVDAANKGINTVVNTASAGIQAGTNKIGQALGLVAGNLVDAKQTGQATNSSDPNAPTVVLQDGTGLYNYGNGLLADADGNIWSQAPAAKGSTVNTYTQSNFNLDQINGSTLQANSQQVMIGPGGQLLTALGSNTYAQVNSQGQAQGNVYTFAPDGTVLPTTYSVTTNSDGSLSFQTTNINSTDNLQINNSKGFQILNAATGLLAGNVGSVLGLFNGQTQQTVSAIESWANNPATYNQPGEVSFTVNGQSISLDKFEVQQLLNGSAPAAVSNPTNPSGPTATPSVDGVSYLANLVQNGQSFQAITMNNGTQLVGQVNGASNLYFDSNGEIWSGKKGNYTDTGQNLSSLNSVQGNTAPAQASPGKNQTLVPLGSGTNSQGGAYYTYYNSKTGQVYNTNNSGGAAQPTNVYVNPANPSPGTASGKSYGGFSLLGIGGKH